MTDQEILAREQRAYLRGYVKALTSCGYWAPEVFELHVRQAERDLARAEAHVATFGDAKD